ncbi:hypothetical protein DAPPUDRAFT_101458 [Daphnia pulex]|uniref:Uncharacterized protein n=1 Tax=Daphnia pulex TaxID=6669 RepID=E9GDF3_DAPPU|nr:hypothetical protein DAPPUDRAFT_101458 [Daphnia pulex]|eukprot:EFX82073.1 hypothetical protein DAPPUDRAFT_101458 [Daphnia pulex]
MASPLCLLSSMLMLRLTGAQRTTTVTWTEARTTTSTVHFSTNLACAQLVNVTGRCRQQRRGFPAAEQPVILVMDSHEHNWFNRHQPFWHQFIATQTFSVEATPLAIIPDWDFHQPPASINQVEPSMQQQRLSGRNQNPFNRQQGYLSKFLNGLFNSIVSTINVTVTNVFTHTLSTTTTNTTSFILMGCTPSPLRYSVCPASAASDHQLVPATAGQQHEEEERKILFKLWKKHKWRPFVTYYSVVRRTTTITAAVISSTVGLCAKLVNVTGACRIRRGLWVDDPIVLSFDDDMDSIDEALSPSRTLSIEPTAMPELSIEDQTKSGRRSVSNLNVRSSWADGPQELEEDEELSRRLGYLNLAAFYSAIRKKLKFIALTVTTVVTVVRTSTYYVTVSTKTFFVQICTPTPFPFSVCPRSSGRN